MSNITTPSLNNLERQWSRLLLILGFVFGILLRMVPVWKNDFPLLDGGMFYLAIEQLKRNAWRLPEAFSYNSLNIPYAYPPFGFYITGFITSVLPISTLQGVQYMPLCFSMLTMVVMYFLAKAVLPSPRQAVIATAFYVVLLRSFEWTILGGGVTRAPGVLFALLTILNSYHLFYQQKTKRVGWVILFGGLTVLSHPDAAAQTITICAVLWFLSQHRWAYWKYVLMIALGGAVLTLPWWGLILFRHGLTPFQAAMKTGGNPLEGLLLFLFVNFSEEAFLPFLTVFAFLGAVTALYRRQFLLPAWFFLPFLAHPRAVATLTMVPLALLCALFLSDVLMPIFVAIRAKSDRWNTQEWNLESFKVERVLIAVLLLYSFMASYVSVSGLPQKYVLSSQQRMAMKWTAANTPISARFLILTGQEEPFHDPIQEWFPVLAQRESVVTVQGREWLPDVDFGGFYAAGEKLQTTCLSSGSLECLDTWQASTGLDYDYIYLAVNPYEPEMSMPMLRALTEQYPLVFSSNTVKIFQISQ